MVSPVIDIDVGTIYEIGERLEEAIMLTTRDMAWKPCQTQDNSKSSQAFLAPAIASASTLNLVELARHAEKRNSIAKELDLGYDRCVPHFHDTRCCTSCNTFVGQNVRSKFLD